MTAQVEANAVGQVGRLEYSPSPVAGVVEHRTEKCTTMFVRPPWTRWVMAMLAPVCMWMFAAALLVLLGLGLRSSASAGWGWLIIPGVFAGLALLMTAEAIVPLVYPVTIEVTGTEVRVLWRRLTRSYLWSKPRVDVRGVSVERVQEAGRKRWHVCVQTNAVGNVGVFPGARVQVERIAAAMRRALGVAEGSAAMRIPALPGCRFQRMVHGDGVMLVLLPRHRRAVKAGTMLASCVPAVVGFLYAKQCNFGVNGDAPGIVVGNAVMLSVLVSGVLFIAAWAGVKQCLKTVGVIRNSAQTYVVQHGIGAPYSISWVTGSGGKFQVEGDERGNQHLSVADGNGKQVRFGHGEKSEDLLWAAEVLNAVKGLEMPADALPNVDVGGVAGGDPNVVVDDKGGGGRKRK